MRKNKLKLGLGVLTVLTTPIFVNGIVNSEVQAEYRGNVFYYNSKPANWWYNDGKDWYFFQNGKKLTGQGKDNAGVHYFINGKYANGKVGNKEYKNGKEVAVENKVPIRGYFNELYYVNSKLANWWYEDGKDWYFFQNGKKLTGQGKDDAGVHYFVDGKYANGKIGDKEYKDGKEVPTRRYLNGLYYINNKPANWWYEDGKDWYFFQNGKKLIGYGKDNTGEHYFQNGKYANWWYNDGKDWYFFQNGRKLTGYGKDSTGEHYFQNGKYANWWHNDGKDWYFFQNGKKLTGYGKDNAGSHYFINGKYQQTDLQKVLDIARSYLGVETGSSEHKKIVDAYNSVNPKPLGYTANYDDDWCDIFVTTVFQQAGLSNLIGRECGVQRHIGIMERKGIWKGKSYPKQGDIVTFDWDGGGLADHIGIVESVNNGVITTIEGNSSLYAGSTAKTRVNRKTYNWDSRYIKGYGSPRY